MSNLMKFGAIDAATEKNDTQAMADTGRIAITAGQTVTVRIFPPMIGEKAAMRRIAQHFIRVPGQTNPVVFNCPRLMAGQYCIGCAKCDEMAKSGSITDAELAKTWRANASMVGRAINREFPQLGVKKFSMSKGMWTQFQGVLSMVGAGPHYSDPVRGFDVRIHREGEKLATKWTMREGVRGPLGTGTEISAWLANVPNLDDDLRVPSSDEIAQLLGVSGAPPRQSARNVADQESTDVQYEDVTPPAQAGTDDEIPF